jgi:ribosomal protein L15
VECTESNNILNPINFSQYQDLIQEIEEKGLEKVEDEGVRQEAEKNLKVLIEGFLSEFSDYEIIYM